MTLEPLSEVAEIVMGQSPPSSTYNKDGNGLPFFQGKADFGDRYPRVRVYCNLPTKIAERGDILIPVRAPGGPTNIAQSRCCIGRGLAAIRGKKVDPIFLLHFFRYHEPQLATQGKGSTFEAINRDDLENLAVPLPPLDKQRKIAALLEKGDRLRRTRRDARQLSDTFLQSVFLEMFGDPVSNPQHWVIDNLRSLCAKFSDGPFGSNLKTSHYMQEGVRVIRLHNIDVGDFLDDDKAYIAPSHFAELKKHECVPGDVLVGTLGDPNLRACIQPSTIPQALNKADCVQARVNVDRATPDYVRGC